MQAQLAAGEAGCPSSFCTRLAHHLNGPLFRALADPGRALLLVRLLEQPAPCTVSQLAAGCGLDVSIVSRQLTILREAGVVHRERRGKAVWCSAQASAVAQILRQLADDLEFHRPDCDACPCRARAEAERVHFTGDRTGEAETCT